MKTGFRVLVLSVMVFVVTAFVVGATIQDEGRDEGQSAARQETVESTANEAAGGRQDRPGRSPARTTVPEANLEIPDELQACAANLRKIYAAIKKYEKEKGTRPDWLSDLVPDYLDKQTLLCRGSGREKSAFWPDPKLPCSFIYEFSPTRLSGNWGAVSGMTCRDWKTRQVEFFGDGVPIVRCGHGSRVLNLSFGGQVYWSTGVWETVFMPDYRRGDELPPGERPYDYTLPTGGVDELLKFIAGLKEYRPRTPQQTTEHSRRAPGALKTAATRILTLEKDEWSAAYQTALRVLMEDRIRLLSRVDSAQQKQLAGFIKTFLTAKAEKTIEPADVRLAASAGRALEEAGNLESAAQLYESCAELVADQKDEKLAGLLRVLQGASRRLALQGKDFMLEGTRMDGATFDWAAYRGKAVLVAFWSAESEGCLLELGHLRRVHQLYGDRAFDVVSIWTDEDRRIVEELLEREQLPWTSLHEPAGESARSAATHYGVTGVPTALLVNEEGTVVSLQARSDDLDLALQELLGPPYAAKGNLTFLDLSAKANVTRTQPLGNIPNNDLRELPQGDQTFAGVKFHIADGVIQLAGRNLRGRPEKIDAIAVDEIFDTVYFLHGTAWNCEDGTVIGQYRVNYEGGAVAEIPIVYGQDLRNWHCHADPKPVTRGTAAWIGRNPYVRQIGTRIRLYLTAWENPEPDKKVLSIDYVSLNTTAAPFCVAMTVDRGGR